MQFNENWLREWVNPRIDSAGLAETLTLAGLEVESLDPATTLDIASANRKKIIVGRISEISPHPDADRLRICAVDIGSKKPLSIVCGAANAAVGLVAPVARIGAVLPGGAIGKSAIRGVNSQGMLCSAAELGLADQSTGLMELDPDAGVGTTLADHLGLDDHVFELGLTPNRGDCLSIRGIAREVAVLTGATLREAPMARVRGKLDESLDVSLDAPEHCPGFAGRIIRDIDMQARTPDWMREKLRRAGLRPINAVVDITNYVMLETGQPMHAYDLDRLSGGIVVRLARKGEQMKLLDGSTVRLKPDNLVIADQRRAVGLAGIMGGDATAISDGTRNIFFEAAFFAPQHIIGKARRLGMHTDASHRFERGVDPSGQVAAVELATRLLLDISGGSAAKTGYAVVRKHLPRQSAILLERSELPRILGIRIGSTAVKRILTSLGMKVTETGSGWKVVPPAWRFDIDGQHDLVEEVGRCHGFDRVAPRMPESRARSAANPEARIPLSRVRQVMTARGYHEAINYSFVDPALQQSLLESGPGIRLTNPLAENLSEMRQSLLPGLLVNLQRNINRQESRVRLFETGNVFLGKVRKRTERFRIAAVACGNAMPRHWSGSSAAVDFFDVKGDLMALLSLARNDGGIAFEAAEHPLYHPGRSARIVVDGRDVGQIGQLHPLKQKLLDLDSPAYMLEMDLSTLERATLPRFVALSRFPSVERDLSLVVDRGVPVEKLFSLIREAAGEYLKSLELFDIYTGDRMEIDKKSVAFSLTFQAESSNLTAGEIDAVTAEIIKVLRQGVGAELRS